MEPDFYQTIEKATVAEYKDRGSKFLSFAFPISSVADFKLHLAALKKEHPKASHHCFAYRLGTDGNSFRLSDDGEPSGSAGRPMMGQLDSLHLTNVLVIVVRYFGGTLLGVPGLIQAYKTSTALALQAATIVTKPVLVFFHLHFDYTMLNEIMRLVKQYECEVIKNDLQLFCVMELGVPRRIAQEMEQKINTLNGVQLEIKKDFN